MTNEMIADAIGNGGNEKLVPVLWERVEKLLYLKSEKAYNALKDRFSAVSVEKNDIKQECYFVFLEALRAYRPPYKFVTFLEFPFKKMLSRLLKSNLSEQEIYTDGFEAQEYEDGYPLSEILADESSDTLLIMDNRTDSEIVRAEVEKLSGKQKDVIKLYYFSDKTDSEIAQLFDNKSESICQLRHRALSNLRRSAVLQKLYFQPKVYYGKNGFLNPEKFYLKDRKRTV